MNFLTKNIYPKPVFGNFIQLTLILFSLSLQIILFFRQFLRFFRTFVYNTNRIYKIKNGKL
jgi:hypothetical protein